MKIRIEIVDEADEEIIIRTSRLDEQVGRIQRAVEEITAQGSAMVLYKGDTQFYVRLEEILFFETSGSQICAHTRRDIFETGYKLYELEKLLPGNFIRVSKSAILNLSKVYSVTRNLTASSEVEFEGTHKKVYVSRNYYKMLIGRLEEKRY